MIQIADHVVDLGPGPVRPVCGCALPVTWPGCGAPAPLTGRHLDHRCGCANTCGHPRGQLSITGTTLHNLKDVDVDIPLTMMAGVASVCEQCEDKRFTPEVLTHTLRGKDISEVLGMSVTRPTTSSPLARPGPFSTDSPTWAWATSASASRSPPDAP